MNRSPLQLQRRVTPWRSLRATAVLDTYWKFASERQEVFFKRVAGSSPPWTDDPILRRYRFTNVYRASDRVSQYLLRNVIYNGEQSEVEVFFRIILFKLFNRIDTWELLCNRLGHVSWSTFDVARYDAVLQEALSSGRKLYSGAYIMPCPPFGEPRKHTNHLMLVDRMMKDDLPLRVASAKSLEQVFTLLRAYPSVGEFLAFQFAIDVNYSTITNFSEMDFVVAGPGARSGIRKVFHDTADLDDEDVIRAIAELADREFERLGLSFRSLWGRPLQLVDYQNIFCEVDKYSRVAYPDAAGGGRIRIKRRFSAAAGGTPQWYPPKWGLEPSAAFDDLQSA